MSFPWCMSVVVATAPHSPHAIVVQIWHHATVMPLFWSLMSARITNHFTLVLANTFTHVFVYGYFTASILKVQGARC